MLLGARCAQGMLTILGRDSAELVDLSEQRPIATCAAFCACAVGCGSAPTASGRCWVTRARRCTASCVGTASAAWGSRRLRGPAGIGTIVQQARGFADVASGAVTLTDELGERRHLKAEAFCNQRVVLVMLADARAPASIGRRVSVRRA